MQNPTTQPTHPTLAEAIRHVESQTDLAQVDRRKRLCALQLFRRVEGQIAPESIRLDATHSVDKMMQASYRALDVSPAHLRNMRSAFNAVLRDLGILAPARPKAGPLQCPAWRVLVASLSASHRPHRLISFVTWCDREGIAPDQVTSDTLEAFLAARIAAKGGRNCRADVAEIARAWNSYGRTIATWPRVQLALRPIALVRAPALTTYSAAMQADVARFLEGVSPPPIGQLFGNSNRDAQGAIIVRPRLSPKTIEARRKAVRSLLWAATEIGTAAADMESLDVLIRPAVAERVLQWHFTRMGKETPTAGLAGYLDTLIGIAAYRQLVGPQRAALADLIRMARPKRRTELTDRNAGLVAILEQPRPRKLLLGCPFDLMAEARRIRDGYTDNTRQYHAPDPGGAARLGAIAAGIEILLHLPLRVADLAALRLDHHLMILNGPRRSRRCRITVTAQKNGVRVETELAGESAALILEYVEILRPHGPHADTHWVFPHRDRADAPRPEGHFSEAISEQIRRHTGIDMNVHAFRAFAALLIVEQDPHALDDIRALLGHKSYETAWRFYMRHNRIAAGARLAETIDRHRRDLGTGR